MIGRMITHTKTFQRSGRQFIKSSTLSMQHVIDKYQLVKKFFIVGTIANLYFCYVSFVKYSIYNEVGNNIMEKFEEFNNTKTKNKEMIFELMREMDSMKNEQGQKVIQVNKAQGKVQTLAVKGENETKKSQSSGKQQKKGWFGFLKGGKKQTGKVANEANNKEYI